jgi:hypothetical protein
MADDAYWKTKYGIQRHYHATNEDVVAVAPLPPKFGGWTDEEVNLFVQQCNVAWQAYENTLFLSGGNREEADRAYHSSLKWQRKEKQ